MLQKPQETRLMIKRKLVTQITKDFIEYHRVNVNLYLCQNMQLINQMMKTEEYNKVKIPDKLQRSTVAECIFPF